MESPHWSLLKLTGACGLACGLELEPKTRHHAVTLSLLFKCRQGLGRGPNCAQGLHAERAGAGLGGLFRTWSAGLGSRRRSLGKCTTCIPVPRPCCDTAPSCNLNICPETPGRGARATVNSVLQPHRAGGIQQPLATVGVWRHCQTTHVWKEQTVTVRTQSWMGVTFFVADGYSLATGALAPSDRRACMASPGHSSPGHGSGSGVSASVAALGGRREDEAKRWGWWGRQSHE